MRKDYSCFHNLAFENYVVMEFELPTDEVDFLVELSKNDINDREELQIFVDDEYYKFIDIINYIQSIPKKISYQLCKLKLEKIE